MKKIFLALSMIAFQACSGTGLLPASDGSTPVSVPTVILNCQTANCRTNVSNPRINVVITTSPCTDPLFGAVTSMSTVSLSCTGAAGCYGAVNGWSSTTIQSGPYNICACINYTGSGLPWDMCNSLGTKSNVTISSGTGQQMISSWVDQ